MNYLFEYNSPIGTLTIASDGKCITGLWIQGQKYFAATLDSTNTTTCLPVFTQTEEWLNAYFNGRKPTFTPPLAPKGTPFRRSVWKILSKIPYGEVITYGDIATEIARQIGKEKMSARAVGNAVGHNPISIIIPCHRVIGKNGSLTGYAGGLQAKISLLTLEHVDMSEMYIPRLRMP
jgi:methylated-DNA-[protein]-cysteine S-methyltransferase